MYVPSILPGLVPSIVLHLLFPPVSSIMLQPVLLLLPSLVLSPVFYLVPSSVSSLVLHPVLPPVPILVSGTVFGQNSLQWLALSEFPLCYKSVAYVGYSFWCPVH